MAFWITLVRGIFAISLGAALIFQPDKSLPILANFMGIYWLISGLVSVRWGAAGRGSDRLALIAGIVGVVAGVGVLGRSFLTARAAEDIVLSLLGVVILLTGVLHALDGFRSGRDDLTREWTWPGFLLGLFEVILGLLLVFSPVERGPVTYIAAAVWAFLGGAILIGDALYLRQQAQHMS